MLQPRECVELISPLFKIIHYFRIVNQTSCWVWTISFNIRVFQYCLTPTYTDLLPRLVWNGSRTRIQWAAKTHLPRQDKHSLSCFLCLWRAQQRHKWLPSGSRLRENDKVSGQCGRSEWCLVNKHVRGGLLATTATTCYYLACMQLYLCMCMQLVFIVFIWCRC